MNHTNVLVGGALTLCTTLSAFAVDVDAMLTPVPFNDVSLADSFWLSRLEKEIDNTVPHSLKETEQAIENLRRCGNFLHGRGGDLPTSHRWISSDLYKAMEGAARTLMIRSNPQLEAELDRIIGYIADAQKEDGYLYVAHICGIPKLNEMGEKPYSYVIHSHELYNMGHMYEGAIAYYRATGKDSWLKVAERNAVHLNKVFFEGDPNYNDGKPIMQAPGHEELELALCQMYRLTGKQLYLDMARKFLDIRGVTFIPEGGTGVDTPTYAQQHKPVTEQEKAVGHSVRAGYLYAAMADASALTGDEAYAAALDRIWHDLTGTKMYITGGCGSGEGIEGFGPSYHLPNNAYSETCAAVANVLFNYNMFILHKDAKYMDVMEVGLFNTVSAGVNLEGNRFFYQNPLESDGKRNRSPWHGCACCPTNIARVVPRVPGYFYSHSSEEIYVSLFASNKTEISLSTGKVRLEMEADYPWSGDVTLRVVPAKKREFTIKLRIPGWARNQFLPAGLYHFAEEQPEDWSVSVNGQSLTCKLDKGYAVVKRQWKRGDLVQLHLSMPPRFVKADDKVKANANRSAITRGPMVYCAEEMDNGGDVHRFFIPSTAQLNSAVSPDLLNGCVTVTVDGAKALAVVDGKPVETDEKIVMVPYAVWNNRGPGSMNVWMPESRELFKDDASL